MAGDFWEVGQWKKTTTGKNFFIRLGTAKQKQDGGFYIDLDSLPLQRADDNGNVRCSIVIQPPRERQDGGPSRAPVSDEPVPF